MWVNPAAVPKKNLAEVVKATVTTTMTARENSFVEQTIVREAAIPNSQPKMTAVNGALSEGFRRSDFLARHIIFKIVLNFHNSTEFSAVLKCFLLGHYVFFLNPSCHLLQTCYLSICHQI